MPPTIEQKRGFAAIAAALGLFAAGLCQADAQQIGTASTSCVRAESWEHVPMIRMCNLNLLPGEVP